MADAGSAAPFVPDSSSLSELAATAATCRGCELFRDATQTVFGKGPAAAPIMLVGEQPGDVEDASPQDGARRPDERQAAGVVDRSSLFATRSAQPPS